MVKEGEELDLGNHHLKFIMAPMVHWPEVMVEYETTEKCYFQQTALVNLGLYHMMKIGLVKQDVIILILLVNMVLLYKLY